MAKRPRFILFVAGIALAVVASTILWRPQSTALSQPARRLAAEAAPVPAKGFGAWTLDRMHPRDITGYVSAISVLPGQTEKLFVRSRASRFDAVVFRMGWYGGAGGTLIEHLRGLRAGAQPGCALDATTHMVRCVWQPSVKLKVGASWTSGAYLIKLISSDRSEYYIPFVVRELIPTAPLLVQLSVSTWQAYNRWGGYDLYMGPCAHASNPADGEPPAKVGKVCRNNRASAVSFDRPTDWPGAGQFFRFEFPLISWLESKGYPLAYATDIDLDLGRESLATRKAFISAGHDEYYTLQMRTALSRALRAGTSLAFFGANDIYKRLVFRPSALGSDRVEALLPPVNGTEENGLRWRDRPFGYSEQRLLGEEYGCSPARGNWVATGQPQWLYQGTGLAPGDAVSGLVGPEFDYASLLVARPPGLVFVARSPLTCHGHAQESDTTIYTTPLGAIVFDSGSLTFDCALAPTIIGCEGVPVDVRIQRLAANLIDAMLHGVAPGAHTTSPYLTQKRPL